MIEPIILSVFMCWLDGEKYVDACAFDNGKNEPVVMECVSKKELIFQKVIYFDDDRAKVFGSRVLFICKTKKAKK
jgi:hypothetical protein